MPTFATTMALGAVMVLTACVADRSDEATDDTVADEPEISVTVPPERLSPFCEGMIELSDELRSGSVEDADALIIERYREIQPDTPLEIAADFDLVLAALEAGLPPPTDPPPEVTAPPPTDPSATGDGTGPDSTAGQSVDEGFDPDSSPTDRINSYVAFQCRSTGNNPGPPATQPLDEPPTSDG